MLKGTQDNIGQSNLSQGIIKHLPLSPMSRRGKGATFAITFYKGNATADLNAGSHMVTQVKVLSRTIQRLSLTMQRPWTTARYADIFLKGGAIVEMLATSLMRQHQGPRTTRTLPLHHGTWHRQHQCTNSTKDRH